MSDGVLFIDDGYKYCRICHEQDLESCKSLESPCHCSGTLKFAHRDCIQRWCDEKGNTTCEICLQICKLRKTKKFRPGYSAPPKKPQLIHTAATISLFVAINEPQVESIEEVVECDDINMRCKISGTWLPLLFTILLLLKNLFDIITGGTQGYPFSLLTVLIVKATGIIVPMYMLFRITQGIHNSINHQHYYQYQDPDSYNEDDEDIDWDDNV